MSSDRVGLRRISVFATAQGKETPISDDETRLKVFLEGRQNIVLKMIFKKIGNEWKHARNEQADNMKVSGQRDKVRGDAAERVQRMKAHRAA